MSVLPLRQLRDYARLSVAGRFKGRGKAPTLVPTLRVSRSHALRRGRSLRGAGRRASRRAFPRRAWEREPREPSESLRIALDTEFFHLGDQRIAMDAEQTSGLRIVAARLRQCLPDRP